MHVGFANMYIGITNGWLSIGLGSVGGASISLFALLVVTIVVILVFLVRKSQRHRIRLEPLLGVLSPRKTGTKY